MASHLDLDEQEQLDRLKAFWKQYGNLIVWVLAIALALFGAWNLWQNHQRDQALKAGVLYEELEKAVQGGDLDKSGRVFADLKERFGRTAYVQQAGLLQARLQFDKGQLEPAAATLGWVAENADETEYQTLARLRLAGLLLDQKKYDEALSQLQRADAPSFKALVADRRGDVLVAKGQKDEAQAAYAQAWKDMDPNVEYRNLIEAKLTALGAPPRAASASPSAPASSASAS